MDKPIHVLRPLFDRLIDMDPASAAEARPKRSLDRRGLRLSIRRELQRLFNTRLHLPLEALEGRERTVLEYGLPDYSHFSPLRLEDRKLLAEQVRRAVVAYEPRLSRTKVDVGPPDGDPQNLKVVITGELVIDEVAEPVSFPTVFRQGWAEVSNSMDDE